MMPAIGNVPRDLPRPEKSWIGITAWFSSLDIFFAVYWMFAGLAGVCIILFSIRWAHRKSTNAPILEAGSYRRMRTTGDGPAMSEEIWSTQRGLDDLQQQRHFRDGNVSRTNLSETSEPPVQLQTLPEGTRTLQCRSMVFRREEQGTPRPGFALVSCIMMAVLCIPIILLTLVYVGVMVRTLLSSLRGKQKTRQPKPINDAIPGPAATNQPQDMESGFECRVISSPTSVYSLHASDLRWPSELSLPEAAFKGREATGFSVLGKDPT